MRKLRQLTFRLKVQQGIGVVGEGMPQHAVTVVAVEDHIASLGRERRKRGVEHAGGEGHTRDAEGIEFGSWIPTIEAAVHPA